MTTLTNEQRDLLVQHAIDARQRAYAPYSHYLVGAALLTDTGKIYEGMNIENAAYSPTICGERVAIFKAVSEGERNFVAIAVATKNAGYPCGVCRQVMAEFGLQTLLIIANDKGQIKEELTVLDLLPGAFTPQMLLES